mmetsp:Transcript_90883/g.190015  ORF Transcript_90883/g.190015 Transcript_90883/m.190015 type:complete len:116 (-) Transcript_90883:1586-1933(-)
MHEECRSPELQGLKENGLPDRNCVKKKQTAQKTWNLYQKLSRLAILDLSTQSLIVHELHLERSTTTARAVKDILQTYEPPASAFGCGGLQRQFKLQNTPRINDMGSHSFTLREQL